VSEKELENLYLALYDYPHVRYLNLSSNMLADVPAIDKMHSLLSVNLQGNKLTQADFLGLENKLVYLQSVNLSQNQLRTLPEAVNLPRLTKLNLNENSIRSLDGLRGHQHLRQLEARKNKINSLEGLRDLPRLEEIFLAENNISSLSSLGDLPKLTFLHLRANQIKSISEQLPKCPKLQRLNLRENLISDYTVTQNLMQFKALMDINISSNPMDEELGGDTRKQLIIFLCVKKTEKSVEKSKGFMESLLTY
jgi:Leucine-rich repeat (LRR) protein